jgi:hypothetical protein
MAIETPLKRQSNCKVSTWAQQPSANQLLDRAPQLARGAKVDSINTNHGGGYGRPISPYRIRIEHTCGRVIFILWGVMSGNRRHEIKAWVRSITITQFSGDQLHWSKAVSELIMMLVPTHTVLGCTRI